jgi:hypothetical protein
MVSPFLVGDFTLSLVAGSRLDLARNLGPWAHPADEHPDPGLASSRDAVPIVRPAGQTDPQPLPIHAGRSAVGRPSCYPQAQGSAALLRQCAVRASHLRRASARHRRALGALDGAAGRLVHGRGLRLRWCGRRKARPPARIDREPQHAAASGPTAFAPQLLHAPVRGQALLPARDRQDQRALGRGRRVGAY